MGGVEGRGRVRGEGSTMCSFLAGLKGLSHQLCTLDSDLAQNMMGVWRVGVCLIQDLARTRF